MRKENLSSPSESRGFPKGGALPLRGRPASDVSMQYHHKIFDPGEVF